MVLVACASSSRAGSAARRGAAQSAPPSTDMRDVVGRYTADLGSLRRTWRVDGSEQRSERLARFLDDERRELDALDFDALDQEGRIDWILLAHEVAHEERALAIERKRREEMRELVPFVADVAELAEAQRRFEPVEPRQAAGVLDELAKSIAARRKDVESRPGEWTKPVGRRAAAALEDLGRDLAEWHRFGQGYDPLFDWWVTKPYEAAKSALDDYAKLVREKVAGLAAGDEKTIVGDPIGREALLAELAHEMIAYTPEELVRIAEVELAWCRERMLEASRELGCGDDWKAALEKVKQAHVEPGAQPALIRQLAFEAVDFLERRELVTIPPLCKETWRMEMMTPERQLVSPFFTGGEVISVSYPAESMTHEQKLMSMRGNNVHFSRATVHHELIPGHHLQGFMSQRWMTHRAPFSTPFYGEGWALYWEMLLWDEDFARAPADRIGMLFWRSHRCARIRFSLGFHLGELTPQQCIDMLVDEVGHERENAEAEVRRSFGGSYGPLYQAAYMLGALQLRDLARELVASGRTSERAFHDGVLQGGNMPIVLVRARHGGTPHGRDLAPRGRFHPVLR
jgi:hypothetical protein